MAKARGVVVLPVDEELGVRVMVTQVVLRLCQHPAGAACGVEQLADRATRGEQLVVLDEEEVHHQPDNLARGEVVAGGLVCQLVEAADEVLEDQPHLLVPHVCGMEVDAAEFRDDEVEDVRLGHAVDFVLELEELEDLAHVLREAMDVAGEMAADVVGVAPQLLEVEVGMVVEALPGDPVQPRVQGLALDSTGTEPLVFGEHLGLPLGQYAVEAAEHRHGQHHALIMWRPVRAPQEVRDLPNQSRKVGVVRHGVGPIHCHWASTFWRINSATLTGDTTRASR